MENYNVLETLGKGAQGTVYLVENKRDGKKYALKKIECSDESEANRAYREHLPLKKLNHPFISGYEEFFVSWDKEISAMFVCVVTDYYENGDLANILRQKQNDAEVIDEMLIKKWLGQITEALIFAHDRGCIHRALKPSNIFIKEDMSICLGDFGVATVMEDARTKTRKHIGSMTWTAPEVIGGCYDELSDVWSLGCVALEIAACSLTDAATMTSTLLNIKHNNEALNEILDQVDKIHSNGLVSVIGDMLVRDVIDRATTKDLLVEPFMADCLSLSADILAEYKKRKQTATTSDPMPDDQGIDQVIDYLQKNLQNEVTVRNTLPILVDLMADDTNLDGSGRAVVTSILREYLEDEDVAGMALQLLNSAVVNVNGDDPMFSEEFLTLLAQAMKWHKNSPRILEATAVLMSALCAEEQAMDIMGLAGVIHNLLETMRAFPDNCSLIVACLTVLWGLTILQNNSRIATEEEAMYDVVAAMTRHKDVVQIQEHSFPVIVALSLEDDNLKIVNKVNCVGLIIQALTTHMTQAKLVQNACMALAALVHADEECAYSVMSDGGPIDEEVRGLPLIVCAFNTHADNAQVVQNICCLLRDLSQYDEICSEMKHMRLADTILTQIHKRFKDNKEIIAPCEETLAKLGGKTQLSMESSNKFWAK